MSVLSRLHPEHPSPRQLNLVIAGSSEVPAVVAEASRLQSSLQKAGHRVTSRLALQNDWSEGRFHPDDGTTADLVLALGVALYLPIVFVLIRAGVPVWMFFVVPGMALVAKCAQWAFVAAVNRIFRDEHTDPNDR